MLDRLDDGDCVFIVNTAFKKRIAVSNMPDEEQTEAINFEGPEIPGDPCPFASVAISMLSKEGSHNFMVDDFNQGENKRGRRLKFQIYIWGSIMLDMVRINLWGGENYVFQS